jgi:3-methylcrotonyl-CoA carboxylase alpha subunit
LFGGGFYKMTFHKILVANRGEIACRILRTCKDMGYETVAVFSDVDKNAAFVREADEAIALKNSQNYMPYLSIEAMIAAAQKSGADAIHPGSDFLSENADFAKRCEQEKIAFIGPSANCIAKMASKAEARLLMKANGIPVLPGYDDEAQDIDTLLAASLYIGFPVLLKPAFGTGGLGIRIVHDANDFTAAIVASQREAKSFCGHEQLIIEKYIGSPMHIEVQIVGDKHGEYAHLFERDCTLQRRYQKIIEESPAVALTPLLRQKMVQAAIKIAQLIRYDSIGTVEFLLDGEQDFYFLEMNTRLQVEHPVTEMLLKMDLIRLQILIAKGEKLPFLQAQLKPVGHAIECRLYAEDPQNQFLPSKGILQDFFVEKAPYVRVDSGLRTNDVVLVEHNPLLAKLIAWGQTRDEANRRLIYALKKVSVLGVKTNRRLLIEILNHPKWLQGDIDTHFIEREKWRFHEVSCDDIAIGAIAVTVLSVVNQGKNRKTLPSLLPGYKNNQRKEQPLTWTYQDQSFVVDYACFSERRFIMHIENKTSEVELEQYAVPEMKLLIDGHLHSLRVAVEAADDVAVAKVWISMGEKEFYLTQTHCFSEGSLVDDKRSCLAPMPGKVLRLLPQIGQPVTKGETLLILEAMKREHTVAALNEGIISAVFVQEGQLVDVGMPLLQFR